MGKFWTSSILISVLSVACATMVRQPANDHKPTSLRIMGCRFGAFSANFLWVNAGGGEVEWGESGDGNLQLTPVGEQVFNGVSYVGYKTSIVPMDPELKDQTKYGELSREIHEGEFFWIPKAYFASVPGDDVKVRFDLTTHKFDPHDKSEFNIRDRRVKCTQDGEHCIRNLQGENMRCMQAAYN